MIEKCSEIVGYSGKRYIASLYGTEFSEAYGSLESRARKSLSKKVKSLPLKSRRLIKITQGIICAPISGHFELEIILTGNILKENLSKDF